MKNEQIDEKIEKDNESQSEVFEQSCVAEIKEDAPSKNTPIQTPAPTDDRAVNDRIDGQNLVKNEKKDENEGFNDLPLPDSLDIVDGTAIDKRWYTLPKRAQQLLILRDCGYTRDEMAEMCHVTPAAITYYMRTYDPQGVLRLTPQHRKDLLAHRFNRLANQAIQNVTPEKLQASSAAQLTTIAAIAVDKLNALAPSAAQSTADVGDLELKLSVTLKR